MNRFGALQAFALILEAGSCTKTAEPLHLNRTTVTQLETCLADGESPGCEFLGKLRQRLHHANHIKNLETALLGLLDRLLPSDHQDPPSCS